MGVFIFVCCRVKSWQIYDRVILRYWGVGGRGIFGYFLHKSRNRCLNAIVTGKWHSFVLLHTAFTQLQAHHECVRSPDNTIPGSLFYVKSPPSSHRRVTGHTDARKCIRRASEYIALYFNPLFSRVSEDLSEGTESGGDHVRYLVCMHIPPPPHLFLYTCCFLSDGRVFYDFLW